MLFLLESRRAAITAKMRKPAPDGQMHELAGEQLEQTASRDGDQGLHQKREPGPKTTWRIGYWVASASRSQGRFVREARR